MATEKEIKAAAEKATDLEVINGIRYRPEDAKRFREQDGDTKARPVTSNKARTAEGNK